MHQFKPVECVRFVQADIAQWRAIQDQGRRPETRKYILTEEKLLNMLQRWMGSRIIGTEETVQNGVIVIEESDSDTDIEIEFENIIQNNNEPINLSRSQHIEFPQLTSDYQDVLQEINKVEQAFQILSPNLRIQDLEPKQGYKHEYETLVEKNNSLMSSLNKSLSAQFA